MNWFLGKKAISVDDRKDDVLDLIEIMKLWQNKLRRTLRPYQANRVI
jgi:hypothetical protein